MPSRLDSIAFSRKAATGCSHGREPMDRESTIGIQSQVFSEKLKKTLNSYHNRAISTMQVLEELITFAKDLDAATKRGQNLGLTRMTRWPSTTR